MSCFNFWSCVVYLCIFFFFKQKTAYEMRISDWSSDVCSSDLHLILNLGVRWDYESTPSYLDFVTPANVIAAFNSQDPNAPAGQTYAQSLAKGGIDVNDYISTGHNRSGYKGEWQPRLCLSYDIDADQEIGRAHV